MADLLEYCPPGEEKTAFFRATYMQRLPADMQVLLVGVAKPRAQRECRWIRPRQS